jgi:hypothetical protein
VQGRLRRQPLSIDIHTACAHCGQAIYIQVEGDMTYRLHSAGAEPLLFMPHVDWDAFSEPNIIQAY